MVIGICRIVCWNPRRLNSQFVKFLTSADFAEWLARAGQVEDPRHAHLDDIPHLAHAQFYVPFQYSIIAGFLGVYVDEVRGEGHLLVNVEDGTHETKDSAGF